MDYIFNTKFICDDRLFICIETVKITVNQSVIDKIPVITNFLNENKVEYAFLRWVGECNYFNDDGDEIEPDFIINSCHMRVFPDASFRFIFTFNESSDKGCTDILELSDAVVISS
jgi:hypothetical protein